MPGVGNLSDTSALAIATLDLSLVQLLTQAMRTADLSSPPPGAGVNTPAQAAERGVQTNAGLRYADHPAATFEKCAVHQWHPRLQEMQPYTYARPVQAVDNTPSIQPPWKTLPWPTAVRPVLPPGHRVIKIQQNNTDVGTVGRTLDLFV